MMNGPDRRLVALKQRPHGDGTTPAIRVLSLSLSAAALRALPPHVLQPGARVRSIALDLLPDEALSGPEAPTLVLSPLLTPEFDALDLARMLSQGGYRGRYLALVARLPSANLIRREVAQQSPNINFDVIVLDGSPPLHPL